MSSPVVLLVIDALNLIRRVHAGSHEDALGQTAHSIRRALRHQSPTHAVAVFDGAGRTFRHDIYPEYKAGRKPMPEDLRTRLGEYRKLFVSLGVETVTRDGLEADDVAATLATKVVARRGTALILSTDRAYCQLLEGGVKVRDHFLKMDVDRGFVMDKFGVPPERLVDFWALAGSSSTHIPGVPGVGKKTAIRLLDEHGDLEETLAAAKRGSVTGRVGRALCESSELARLSFELAALRCDLDLGWNLSTFRFRPESGSS